MKEIEVGDYVRTKKGIIGELISETLSYPEPSEWKLKVNNSEIIIVENEDYPVKHSKQLKDLVGSGDLIIYRLRGLKHQSEGFIRIYKDARSEEESLGVDNYSLEQIEIIKILTHEQFEANCYKVGGEDER